MIWEVAFSHAHLLASWASIMSPNQWDLNKLGLSLLNPHLQHNPFVNHVQHHDMVYHRPAESSTASMLKVESSTQSESARGIKSISWPRRTISTFCHSSHLSANPSPSSMRTTSAILGLSVGDICVHSNATCIVLDCQCLPVRQKFSELQGKKIKAVIFLLTNVVVLPPISVFLL